MDKQYVIEKNIYDPYEKYYSSINYESGKGWYIYKDYKSYFLGHDISEAVNNLKDKIDRNII